MGRRDTFEDGFSLERWFSAPWRWMQRRWQQQFDRDPFDERPTNFFVDLLLFPFRLVASIGVFMVSGWAGSRSAWAFLLGLPAVAGILVVCLGALGFTYLSQRNYFRYHGNGLLLLREKDQPNALGYLRKSCLLRFPQGLAGVPADEKDWMVDVGDALAQGGSLDDAIAWIETVSPRDVVGNFSGHLWIARHLLELPGGPTPEQLAAIHDHLANAELQKGSYVNEPELEFGLHETYVRYCRLSEDTLGSVPHLKRMAEIDPRILPFYLRALKDSGDDAKFQSAYREGMTRLTELAAAWPNQLDLWTAMANSAVVNKTFPLGWQILQNGLTRITDEQARQTMALICSNYLLVWHNDLFAPNDETKFRQGINLLAGSLQFNPRENPGYELVVKLLGTEPLSEQQLRWYLEQVNQATLAPDILQALLGAYYLWHDADNGVTKARSYWTIAEAYSGNEGNAQLVLSNLALYLGRQGAESRQRGLELLDLAISNSPTKPVYSLAKGRLLMDAEEWGAARKVLEELVGGKQPNLLAAAMLVQCAEKLGDSAAAEKYRRIQGER